MASLEESLLASAIETLDIEEYWPTFDSTGLDENDDSEYSIILFFYETLVDSLMQRHRVLSYDVQSAIEHLVHNYSNVWSGRTPENLNYNILSNCLGYLHRYAACHTALVLSVMVRVFHKSPPAVVRRILALKDQLNVVCLGSGPGNDLLGFLSAIYGKHFGLLELDITLVDKHTGWEVVFNETIARLRRGECGNVSKIFNDSNIVTSFLQGDLRTPSAWSVDLRRKLLGADIMLLVKVLSVVPNDEKLSILQNIVMSMKPGGLLVFIDCPFPEIPFAVMSRYLDVVYEACKEKFDFNFEVARFGYTNIITSKAYVRIFVKKFIRRGS